MTNAVLSQAARRAENAAPPRRDRSLLAVTAAELAPRTRICAVVGHGAGMTTSESAADPAAIRSAADALATLRGPITSALDDAQAELTAAQAQPLPPGTRPSPALAALAEMVPAMAAEAATVADQLDRIADELRHDAEGDRP